MTTNEIPLPSNSALSAPESVENESQTPMLIKDVNEHERGLSGSNTGLSLNIPEDLQAQLIEVCKQVGMEFSGDCVLFHYGEGNRQTRVRRLDILNGKEFERNDDGINSFFAHQTASQSENKDFLILTASELDCVALHVAGCSNAVAIPNGIPLPGAQNDNEDFRFLQEEKSFLDEWKYVVLVLGSSEAERAFESEIARRIGLEHCYRVEFPEGYRGAFDLLLRKGKQPIADLICNAKPYPLEGIHAAGELLNDVLQLHTEGCKPGLSTGWKGVDEHYTVRTREMTIVTGIPGSGKSTWLDALCVNLWRNHGWRFAYCSPENWPIQRHVASILEKITGKSFAQGYSWERISEEEIKAATQQIEDSFFFITQHEHELTIDSILSKFKAAIFRNGVRGCIIDPWNELEASRPAALSETEYISRELGKLRRFARLHDVHLWIVAHPTKLQKDKNNGKYPVPKLYDVAGSAHFYNKADNGITVHRPDKSKDITEVHVTKVRFREVGMPGMATLRFSRENGRYFE